MNKLARHLIKVSTLQDSRAAVICWQHHYATDRANSGDQQIKRLKKEENGSLPKESNSKLLLVRGALPVALGGGAVLAAPFAISALGFGAGGIAAGSIAAKMMSLYGGSVASGSIVAILQSAGAAGISTSGYMGIFSGVFLSSAGIIALGSKIKGKKTEMTK